MDKIIFFATLIIFPFGQIFKIGYFNLIDIAVVLLALITFCKKPKYPNWYRYFIYFILTCLFSLVVNYKFFEIKSLLYLIRLLSYFYVAIYIFNFISDKKNVVNSLLAISISSAIFGWIQYFIWPDLTSLKYLGWDDHLLRMVGTFLDPTFLGLILVLGMIIAVQQKHRKIIYFLLFSLAFTYSRSSYLVAVLYLFSKKKFLTLVVFFVIILLLPKNIGEGTNLARTASAENKLINYQETIEIIKKSPVIGVGFNNICPAKVYYFKTMDTDSHACSGADSSILFILATTGIIGLILFISLIKHTFNDQLLIISFAAILLHSIFVNSLFYPHIMYWIFILLGLGSKTDSE